MLQKTINLRLVLILTLINGMIFGLNGKTHALPQQVLTDDKKLDVGSALILSQQVVAECKTSFDNRQKAWQCQQSCGSLGERVKDLSITIARNNPPQAALKSSYGGLAQFSIACFTTWKDTAEPPQSLGPFLELFNYLKEGNSPVAGQPISDLSDRSEYVNILGRSAASLQNIEAFCNAQMGTSNCLKFCDIVQQTGALASILQAIPSDKINQTPFAKEYAQALQDPNSKLNLQAQRCGQQFGRFTPQAINDVMQITMTITSAMPKN